METHTYSPIPIMCKSLDTALDSVYCGKWKKNLKSSRDLDLTMPEQLAYPTIYSN